MIRHAVILIALALGGALLGALAWLWLESDRAYYPELTLLDLDGAEHDLADYRGELVLVNFWATWCAPCMREIPMLIEAQEAFGAQGLQILGPALDDADAVQRFAGAMEMNYPVFAGVGQVGPALSILGDTQGALPFTVLLDRDGRLIEQHYGEMDRAALDALIVPLLAP